jgi:hypothetical protein
MLTRRFAALSIATMTMLAMVIVLVQAGCGGPSKRARTLQTVLVSVNAARDGFDEYDRQQQQHVLEASPTREEYAAEIEAYKKARAPVLQAFEVAYRALAIAALQRDEVSLKQALDQVSDLLGAVNKLTGKGP